MTITTRRLYLLRHAKALNGSFNQDDHERALAPRGLEQASALGTHLRQTGIEFDEVYCSTATRTRQTLTSLQEAYGEGHWQVEFLDALYHASAARMLDILQSAPESARNVLMIGHNPGIGELAATLSDDGDADIADEARLHFPTCTLAIFTFDAPGWLEITPAHATINEFLTPERLSSLRQLKAAAS